MGSEQFKQVILPLRQQLFRISLKLLNDEQDAEDAVQESLLKLWHDRDKLQTYDNPAAFASTITRNYCLDKIKLRKQTVAIESNSSLAGSGDPYLAVELKNSAGIIKAIISRLPALQQSVITMKDVEEYEIAEIAEITGSSEESIRMTLSRARKKVRDEYLKIINR
ncbi:MAG: RNA polymerase sigma factor [Paludibacteraceae bacterium]